MNFDSSNKSEMPRQAVGVEMRVSQHDMPDFKYSPSLRVNRQESIGHVARILCLSILPTIIPRIACPCVLLQHILEADSWLS
jgi:hypothetical protein